MKAHLRTQMEVAEQDGGLGAGDDQDHKHEEQESIPVMCHKYNIYYIILGGVVVNFYKIKLTCNKSDWTKYC